MICNKVGMCLGLLGIWLYMVPNERVVFGLKLALEHTIIGRNVYRPFVGIQCTHCLISSPKPSTTGMNAFITQFTYIYACPMACAVYDEKCVLRIFNINTQNVQFKFVFVNSRQSPLLGQGVEAPSPLT